MIRCFPTVKELAEHLSSEFLKFISEASLVKDSINIAFSGGNTPGVFFEQLASDQAKQPSKDLWRKVHFFWVDERCVPPDHADSNYGMTKKRLLDRINISPKNIHRIRGEHEPVSEAIRYGGEIDRNVRKQDGIPVFDWIFLGIGNDGHTASIFPNRMDLISSDQLCAASSHPDTGQFRVTLTGRPLVKGQRITFLVTGESKSVVIRQIISKEPEATNYPAAQIYSLCKNADLYTDKDASVYLNISCRGKY